MTVREIAELAGVSIGTVDRVLHQRGRVAPETAEKIGAIIERYQFTPNPIARRLKRNRAYRFYTVVPCRDQDAGYWDLAIRGIQEVGEELAPLGVETKIIEYDHYDDDALAKIEQEVMEALPDGVIFAPIYPQISLSFLEKLREKHIPYVFFDSDLPDAEPICTIKTNAFKGGYLAGKLLHLYAGTISGPIVIRWAPLNHHIRCRREGFLHYAEKHGFASLIRNCPDEDEAEIMPEAIATFLQTQRDLQGIFVSYADVRHAVEILEARRKQGNLFVVGYDLVPDNYQLLKEGKIDAIISQRPQEQGRQAMFSLFRHIVLGWKIEARIEMSLEVYFKENIPEAFFSRSYRVSE